MSRVERLTRMAILVALGVVSSYFSAIPLFGAKLFPAQHAINVVAGAMLGPVYGGVVGLGIAVIRILLGSGTPLAVPGTIFGVVLAGLLYQRTGSRLAAMAGEVIGTGLVGAVAAYPVAVLLLDNAKAAAGGIGFFIPSFAASSAAGALIGGQALVVLQRFRLMAAGRAAYRSGT
ncbi:energy coupling factor transporter S component ThiW [Symbiobacterium terraclitae]|uniref:Energy coupling factor transporter S component ThiW n=1 Tax=Symbiobacterium terraclitae TaxID=557451 RepID=A0ABS4JR50_9FIRM|nr:energy coupling factor transporter S component ThiW [Symbiobacterium terraclitae]MBP2018005.1 energy coupling factor transporter S component ThiW [Symbiobacterium terraclitae]